MRAEPSLSNVPGAVTGDDGIARFRGIPIEQTNVTLAGRDFIIYGLKDASELLNEPDYAAEFVDHDRAPYGLELWPAAQMLARWIIEKGGGTGGRALELGCGLGLVSIAAAGVGWKVVATDRDPVALQFAHFNAMVNTATGVTFASLDWSAAGKQPGDFDRVFAADVLYEKCDHGCVLSCVAANLSPTGVAYVADPMRGVADRFPGLARVRGFEADVSEVDCVQIAGREVRGRIFALTRR